MFTSGLVQAERKRKGGENRKNDTVDDVTREERIERPKSTSITRVRAESLLFPPFLKGIFIYQYLRHSFIQHTTVIIKREKE